MKFPIPIQAIADLCDATLEGNADLIIEKIVDIKDPQPGGMSFLYDIRYEKYIYQTKASAVLVDRIFQPKKKISATLLRVNSAKESLLKLLNLYEKNAYPVKKVIEHPSYRGQHTKIGKHCYQGAFSYIGNHVTIEDHVQIYPHVYIGDHVKIASHTILYSGAKVYSYTRIGKHCIIHSGVVIGSDGFGFLLQENGKYEKIPQIGKVILKNHVEIGPNTTIDRAMFSQTLLEEGVKMGSLIQIGHNVEIGENTVIISQTGISGSTKVGKDCLIAGQVGIVGHVTIGDQTVIGGKSKVTKSFPKGHVKLLGNPAIEKNKYLRCYNQFIKLDNAN